MSITGVRVIDEAGWLSRLSPSDVHDWKSFADYCHQQTGIPYPTQKDIGILRKFIKRFFEQYPNATYFTLCRIVGWAKAKKKRYATPGALISNGLKYAWEAGYLPELDPSYEHKDENLEAKMEEAIKLENHDGWLRRLTVSEGVDARREVYAAWVKYRGEQFGVFDN